MNVQKFDSFCGSTFVLLIPSNYLMLFQTQRLQTYIISTPSIYGYFSAKNSWNRSHKGSSKEQESHILPAHLRYTVTLVQKIHGTGVIKDHLKNNESKLYVAGKDALYSLISLASCTSGLSLHRSLTLNTSQYIIIYCNKIFKTMLEVRILLQYFYYMLQLSKKV
jgi:hypothetical protein